MTKHAYLTAANKLSPLAVMKQSVAAALTPTNAGNSWGSSLQWSFTHWNLGNLDQPCE